MPFVINAAAAAVWCELRVLEVCFLSFFLLLFSQNHSDGQDESGSIILMVSVFIKLFQTRSTACVWLCVHKRHICTKKNNLFLSFHSFTKQIDSCLLSVCSLLQEHMCHRQRETDASHMLTFSLCCFLLSFAQILHNLFSFFLSLLSCTRETIKKPLKRRERRKKK